MIRRIFLPAVTVLSAIVFIGKLISLQILNSSYKILSDGNAVIENSLFPERGYIYDRNHKLLVSNQPIYDLMTIPENITLDTLELSKILEVSEAELKKNQFCQNFSVKLPYIVVGKISKERNAIIQRRYGNTQVFLYLKGSVRNYPVSIASNLLGYVSEVNRNDMKKDDYYSLGESIGRQGIEEYYENF